MITDSNRVYFDKKMSCWLQGRTKENLALFYFWRSSTWKVTI